MITVHGDHGVRVWDFRQGHTLGKARQHSGAVTAARLAPGGTFVTASTDGTVRSWPLGPDRRKELELDERSSSVGFVPFVFGFDEGETRLRFWSDEKGTLASADTETGRVDYVGVQAGGGGPLRLLRASGDGGTLLAATAEGEVLVLDVRTGRVLGVLKDLRGCAGQETNFLAVSHSGSGLLTWCEPNGVELRRLPDGARVGAPLRLKERPLETALSDDLKTAWLIDGDGVLIADPTRAESRRVEGVAPAYHPRVLGLSADAGRAVLAIQTSRPSDGAAGVGDRAALRVFDGRTGQPLSGLMVPDGLNAAAFSADGRLVVTCGRRLQSWDAETGMAIGGGVDCGLSEFIHIGPLGGVAFSGTQGSTVGLVNLRPVREPAAALRRQAEVEGILRLDETTGAVQPLSKEVWEARRREPVAAAPGLALPIAGHDTKY